MNALDFRLLNDFQRAFPLVNRPYAAIGNAIGASEEDVIGALTRLHAEGVVSRVGAVFTPRALGASTLAAIAAPPDRVEDCARIINRHAGVNHNYLREHAYNLWFVVTAPDEARLEEVLASIRAETQCRLIKLPLLEEFHIDLGFDLAGVCKASSAPRTVEGTNARVLSDVEQAFVAALQDGLDLVPRPFAALAARAGLTEQVVLEKIAEWSAAGLIKRFGVVVRHQELGYTANAMVVWDVPDERVHELGVRLATEPEVTLCYRRARQRPDWLYNLFCMIHGRSRGAVQAAIDTLVERHGLACFPHAVLFSTRRYKQNGARYA